MRTMEHANRSDQCVSDADEHALVRSGLNSILGTQDGREICAVAETGGEAVAMANRILFATFDLNMPGVTEDYNHLANSDKTLPGIEPVILTCRHVRAVRRREARVLTTEERKRVRPSR